MIFYGASHSLSFAFSKARDFTFHTVNGVGWFRFRWGFVVLCLDLHFKFLGLLDNIRTIRGMHSYAPWLMK